ncbi:murein hydrolase activator EnvC family protein [Spiribacter halobius]|uniref:Peptidase M23 n=1 Tax=Sediminicurvatus halobius TaxID=2182432 RepID=A0A2U2N2Y7_9GAMM|nr:peptidoglycan DD-metalloendopeptidase family protein [Spiribacter halobius]PWG63427.1 peptidase M23 [Spiribacter halobius]UEX78098.1 peptidoglycan DD-metalloendopeptidase family protein [Spiribacter halobius]
MTRILHIFTGLALGLLAAGAAAQDDVGAKAERLETLRERIGELEAAIDQDRQREDSLSAGLAELERRIGEIAGDVRALEREIAARAERVEALESEIATERENVARQRERLAAELRAAYRVGREGVLRLLLNQEDPDRVDRMIAYYGYLGRARGERIEAALDAVETLRRLRERRRSEQEALEQARAERESRLQRLEAGRAEREALLAELRERIERQGGTLADLEQQAEALADLVGRLRDTLADIPETTAEARPFPAHKGDLAWPLEGRVLAGYGSQRSGGVRWTGLLIDGEQGAPVRAVAHGRVVFADWLRGLGLLLIIDHGDGYLTLYGRNQSLYREVGDWVAPGEVIAAVGDSGGRRGSALYFEVRADGDPVDPVAWLRSRS